MLTKKILDYKLCLESCNNIDLIKACSHVPFI